YLISHQGPEAVVSDFCTQLDGGNITNAYHDFSPGFQSRVSEETFYEKVNWIYCDGYSPVNNSQVWINFHKPGNDDANISTVAVLFKGDCGIWTLDRIDCL